MNAGMQCKARSAPIAVAIGKRRNAAMRPAFILPFGWLRRGGACFVARLANSCGYWPRRASRIRPHGAATHLPFLR